MSEGKMLFKLKSNVSPQVKGVLLDSISLPETASEIPLVGLNDSDPVSEGF